MGSLVLADAPGCQADDPSMNFFSQIFKSGLTCTSKSG